MIIDPQEVGELATHFGMEPSEIRELGTMLGGANVVPLAKSGVVRVVPVELTQPVWTVSDGVVPGL